MRRPLAPAPGCVPGRCTCLPWLLTLAALTVVPVIVYLVAYSPWIELGNDWGLPLLGSLPFLPEGSDGGQTIVELTESMYRYHDNLRAEHAASSPWWAWPLDLKPVWFFQERFVDGTIGLIYDAGNLVVFWLGIAGHGLQRLGGLAPPQPGLGHGGGDVGGDVAALGARRPGCVPVPRLRQPAVHAPVAGLLPRRALAWSRLAHLVPGARRGRAGDHRHPAAVAAAHAALHPRGHRGGPPRRRGLCRRGHSHRAA